MQSHTADGRCVPWGVLLSQWNLDVREIQRDEDGLAAILGAGITPREHLDEVAEEFIPAKGRAKPLPIISVEMLEDTFKGIVLSFDGAAKTSTWQGSCGCILWELPGWKILDAQDFILEDVTVNDAEYCGLLNGLIMAQARGVRDLIAVGDSRIVIPQVQGLINCGWPAAKQKTKFDSVRLVHFKRDFNQAADYLTSKTLLLGRSWSVQEDGERQHLERVSKIQEKLMKSAEGHLVTGHSGFVITQVEEGCPDNPGSGCPSALDVMAASLPSAANILVAVTRASVRDQQMSSEPLDPLDYQRERWRRIKVHQEQDEYLCDLRDFLNGEVDRFTLHQLRKIAKVADLFALDARGVLYRLAQSTRGRPRDAQDELRLVVPITLRQDILHYAHEDFQGGHQGIKRTHEKLRYEFYWPGIRGTARKRVCGLCKWLLAHLLEISNQDDHLKWS
ncbi:LOW QUALITY PROTEIN: hypothetical protein PHMEG_00020745 [Phytophthora megakarya]|uniref:Reverse transcriptase n=1 Tax=Phytophthora megakarya TaxID=4795 RepID=A0A225VND8_9STRA|nr:LOW QUALITY PROTEIN: hypothetical protein PHMEG_00020745 [Phytophthora megakarya]